MDMIFCPQCGEKLRLRERSKEEPALYCKRCGDYRFPHFSAAIAAVVLDGAGENILLIRQYGEPHFVLPAGYIDKGESAEEAVVREIGEELGMSVQSLHFLKSHYYAPSETLMLNFLVTAAGTEPQPNWEVDSWEWASASEAIGRVIPGGLAEVFLRDFEEWKKA